MSEINEQEKQDRQEALDALLNMYQKASQFSVGLSRSIRRLEISIITLSAVTTGSLWAAIGKISPEITTWLGAILATLLTILAMYKKAFNPEKRYKDALALYGDIGRELANVRTNFDYYQFWGTYKELQVRLLGVTEKDPLGRNEKA